MINIGGTVTLIIELLILLAVLYILIKSAVKSGIKEYFEEKEINDKRKGKIHSSKDEVNKL